MSKPVETRPNFTKPADIIDVQVFTIIERNFRNFLHVVIVRENRVKTTQSFLYFIG